MARSRFGTLALAALVLGLAPAARAGIINPSFEDGTTSGWATVGSVSVVDASYGVTPSSGSYQILFGTGTGSASVASTESALNLVAGTIQSLFDSGVTSSGSGPTEGSAFQQAFTAVGGDRLTFDWNLLTDSGLPDSVATDFLWYQLVGPNGKVDSGVLGDLNDGSLAWSASASPYAYETGYQTITIKMDKPGTYTLTLGINDVNDQLVDTGAVIDNFHLRKTPEPGTGMLLGLGLALLAGHARRRR